MRTLRGHQEAAAGTAVLMLAVVLTAPLHYGFGLALTWLLPAADFGVVSVLLTVLLLATTVLAAGFPWALARTVARAEDGDPEAAAEVDAAFRSALVGNVGLGAALALGFAGVQLTTGAILPGVGAGVTLLAAGTIVLVAIGQVLLGGLQGARRFAAVSGARVVEVLVKVVVGAGAVALIGSGAVGVGWGLLLGAAAAALWAWWTMRDRLPRLRGALAGWRSFAAAAPMAVGTTGFGLIATLDVLLLGPLGHAHGVTFAAIGTYQAAALLAKAPFLVGSTLSDAVFPSIARARGAAEAHGWVVAAMRWVPLALVPVLLVLVVTPDALVGRIFPVEHAAAGNLARLIAVGTLGLVVGDMLLKALFARGLAGAAAARIPAAAIAEVATMVAPRTGVRRDGGSRRVRGRRLGGRRRARHRLPAPPPPGHAARARRRRLGRRGRRPDRGARPRRPRRAGPRPAADRPGPRGLRSAGRPPRGRARRRGRPGPRVDRPRDRSVSPRRGRRGRGRRRPSARAGRPGRGPRPRRRGPGARSGRGRATRSG